MALVLGCSLGLAYKINKTNFTYVGIVIFLMWGLILFIGQRRIVKKSKIDIND